MDGRTGDLSKTADRRIVRGVRELRMIQQIKELVANLQKCLLADSSQNDVLHERSIEVELARSFNYTGPAISPSSSVCKDANWCDRQRICCQRGFKMAGAQIVTSLESRFALESVKVAPLWSRIKMACLSNFRETDTAHSAKPPNTNLIGLSAFEVTSSPFTMHKTQLALFGAQKLHHLRLPKTFSPFATKRMRWVLHSAREDEGDKPAEDPREPRLLSASLRRSTSDTPRETSRRCAARQSPYSRRI